MEGRSGVKPEPDSLHVGDCLNVMGVWPDAFVDLCYLDPPFNSNYDYAFRGTKRIAFSDKWSWDGEAAERVANIERRRTHPANRAIAGLHMLLGDSGAMAYLSHMAERIAAIWRILAPTGSIWLHCDGYACHYLKVLLDAVFGHRRFRNQVVVKRSGVSHNAPNPKRLPHIHDVLLVYGKSTKHVHNQPHTPYSDDYLEKNYRHVDEGTGRRYRLSALHANRLSHSGPVYEIMGVTGMWTHKKETMQKMIDEGIVIQTSPGTTPVKKTYLDERKGVPIHDLWIDVGIRSRKEDAGYPTQKPLALLRRIIETGSNPGDLVLDPFCGSGTTLVAARDLDRRYIGVDKSDEAAKIASGRLRAGN